MGSPDGETGREEDEGPQHQVTISNPFYIGIYELTQTQWMSIMGDNPSEFRGSNDPVANVSWEDCQTFIQNLNQLVQGSFRLPTEAEWEYACRAGTTTRFSWGDDSSYSQIGQYEWYSSNSNSRTNEVGLKLPNAWGLYDMSGNVHEWCQDWYGDYTSAAVIDPSGSPPGPNHVDRGGDWSFNGSFCRSAYRSCARTDTKSAYLGFRLVRSLTP